MRNSPRCKIRCSSVATDRSSVAITLAAALPPMISLARLGPDRAQATRPGSTSRITSVIRNSVPASKPFVRLTTGIQWGTCGAACSSTARKPWDGTPTTTTSALDTASSMSLVARRSSGKVKPARYDGFSCFSLTAAVRSGLRAQSVVGLRPALSEATVVPQDPAPSTVTRIGRQPSAELFATVVGHRRPHDGRRPAAPVLPQRALRQRLEHQLREQFEVLGHHPLGREVALHRRPAGEPVEFGHPVDQLGHVGLVPAEETGAALLHHLSGGAFIEGEDGPAAVQRLRSEEH